jgi:hypothetical protein
LSRPGYEIKRKRLLGTIIEKEIAINISIDSIIDDAIKKRAVTLK